MPHLCPLACRAICVVALVFGAFDVEAAAPTHSGIPEDEAKVLTSSTGDRVVYDRHSSVVDAQSLAATLLTIGYFGRDGGTEVLLRGNRKRGRAIVLLSVPQMWEDQANAKHVRFITEVIRAKSFARGSLRVHICDETVVCHQTFTPTERLGLGVVLPNKGLLFFNGASTLPRETARQRAAKSAEALSAWAQIVEGAMVLLDETTGDAPSLCLAVADESYARSERVLSLLERLGRTISNAVYQAKPVQLRTCNRVLRPMFVAPDTVRGR